MCRYLGDYDNLDHLVNPGSSWPDRVEIPHHLWGFLLNLITDELQIWRCSTRQLVLTSKDLPSWENNVDHWKGLGDCKDTILKYRVWTSVGSLVREGKCNKDTYVRQLGKSVYGLHVIWCYWINDVLRDVNDADVKRRMLTYPEEK